MITAVVASTALNALDIALFAWLVKTGHITIRKPPRPKPREDPS